MYDKDVIEEMEGKLVARAFHDELEKIAAGPAGISKELWRAATPSQRRKLKGFTQVGEVLKKTRGARASQKAQAHMKASRQALSQAKTYPTRMAVQKSRQLDVSQQKVVKQKKQITGLKKQVKKPDPMADWQRYGVPTAAGAGGLAGGYVLGRTLEQ